MVPFNGSGPALNAMIAGQTDYMCSPIPDVVQQVMSEMIKAFAIGSSERSAALPNVPTSTEGGLPGFQATGWFGLFAPKDVPNSILERLSDALDGALDDTNVRTRLLELGCDIPDKSQRGPQQLAELVKSEIARWTPIIKGAKS